MTDAKRPEGTTARRPLLFVGPDAEALLPVIRAEVLGERLMEIPDGSGVAWKDEAPVTVYHAKEYFGDALPLRVHESLKGGLLGAIWDALDLYGTKLRRDPDFIAAHYINGVVVADGQAHLMPGRFGRSNSSLRAPIEGGGDCHASAPPAEKRQRVSGDGQAEQGPVSNGVPVQGPVVFRGLDAAALLPAVNERGSVLGEYFKAMPDKTIAWKSPVGVLYSARYRDRADTLERAKTLLRGKFGMLYLLRKALAKQEIELSNNPEDYANYDDLYFLSDTQAYLMPIGFGDQSCPLRRKRNTIPFGWGAGEGAGVVPDGPEGSDASEEARACGWVGDSPCSDGDLSSPFEFDPLRSPPPFLHGI